ncbi:MAG TPA: HAD family hydrolase [Anaerolineales bacterium]|nr:HAD family hydrolase [Anaerolineales bacterium]
MFRAVFLDRDGVLIENRSDYVRDWSHVTILPLVTEALSLLHKDGIKIIIVTNQSAVGRGLVTLETVREINDCLIKTLKENGGWIDAVYMCHHAPQDHCTCRKPLPGLLLQAARELSLDLRSSWIVGDAWSDVLAGQSAGLQGTIMVRTGRGSSQLVSSRPIDVQPFLISDDLFNASKTIIDIMKKIP